MGADVCAAGIPTLIKPWFGDQFFWASRVQRLGVRRQIYTMSCWLTCPWYATQAGLRVPSLRVSDLTTALKKATSDRYGPLHAMDALVILNGFMIRIMREKANIVGQKIRNVSHASYMSCTCAHLSFIGGWGEDRYSLYLYLFSTRI